MTGMEALTSWPEFQAILEEAYKRAWTDGQQDERDRCVRLAGEAVLEQNEAGHPRNGDTWHAACAWVRMRIDGKERKAVVSQADLIREEEHERCWRICNEYRQLDITAVDVIAARIKGGK